MDIFKKYVLTATFPLCVIIGVSSGAIARINVVESPTITQIYYYLVNAANIFMFFIHSAYSMKYGFKGWRWIVYFVFALLTIALSLWGYLSITG